MGNKKFWKALVFIGLAFASGSHAQSFTEISTGITGVGRSSLAWGDYDKDGDLDLLVTGNQGSGPYIASVYRNDNGTFTDINANLTGIDNSAVAWGDYDNDGDLDILATGRSSTGTTTWLYRNKNGEFTQVNNPFPNIGSYGCVAWSDFDGDGDLDAFISGAYTSNLFRNDAGQFTNTGLSFPFLSNSWVNFGDFDNDGDQDIFLCGDIGGWPVSAICRNDGGVFIEFDSSGIIPVSSASASWCDYDHDNDLDVLISGFDQYLVPATYIFRNDGDLNFSNVWPGLTGSALGTSAWCDYDNDGDFDVLVTGQNALCGSLSSTIYRNDGNDNFINIHANLVSTERGSAAWGDYDNDGDADVVISGFNESGFPVTKLYRNNAGVNSFINNSPPDVPSGLNITILDHKALINWNSTTDDNTPVKGICYNLKIGTVTGGQDILTANTDQTSNSVLLPQANNVSNDTSWILNLPDGNYYCSVQANDQSMAASDFSEEKQFSISNVGLDENTENLIKKISPNPFFDRIVIEIVAQSKISIYSCTGVLRYSGLNMNSAPLIIDTSLWKSGIYILRIDNGRSVNYSKLIRY